VDPVFLGALVLALFAALGIDAASRDVITLPFWLRAYDGLSLPHFLGGANLGLSFEHISLIGVICYFWCRFSYAVTDEILTTPLFTWEQPVPYIINFLILGTLFIAILGSDHLVGAVAFAALGAAAMIWKLDKVSW
jgi:hypothetical protein